MEIKVIETRQELREIEPLWESFARENSLHLCNSYFWQVTARENYFSGAPIRVFLFYEGSELRGILPLCFTHSSFVKLPVRKYHFFEQGIGLTTLLFQTPALPECFRKLWENLPHFLPEFNLLKLTLAEAQKDALLPFFRGIREEGFTALVAEKKALALQSASEEDYFKNVFNSRQRRDHKRLTKKMQQDYQVQIEPVAGGDLLKTFDAYWQRFLSIYQNSWKHYSQRSLSSRAAETAFFNALFYHYATQQLAYLSFLRLGSHDVAAVWMVKHRGSWYGLQTVYDEAFKQYSPGIYLIQETVFSLIQDAPVHIDFMGSQEYKRKFSNVESAYYDVYILSNSLYGKMLGKLSAKSKMDFQII